MNTIELSQQFDTAESEFLAKWTNLGKALISLNAGKVSLTVSNNDKDMSQNVFDKVGLPYPAWHQHALSKSYTYRGGLNIEVAPSARLTKQDITSISSISGHIDVSTGVTLVHFTQEGLQQIKMFGNKLNFAFVPNCS